MPVNLLSAAVAWLLTHLVVLSLLGFLLVGLFVFGLVETPATVSVQQKKVLPAPAPSRSDTTAVTRAAPGAEQTTSDAAESRASAASDRGARNDERPQPKLIGGSLPMHGQGSVPLSPPGTAAGPADEEFRPPAEGPGPVDAGMTREDYVQQARRAFWNGEFEAAEAAYLALLSEYPADADAFGELGNLYQSMAKPERALDAYYEAAVRLKAAGESDKLKQVIELLTREGDPRADQLGP